MATIFQLSRTLAGVAVLTLIGCRTAPPGPLQPPHSPLAISARATSGGAIAFGNLAAEVDSLEQALSDGRIGTNFARLIDALLMRAHYRASIKDAERALELSEQLLAERRGEPASWLARARIRSAFHLFDDALSDLAEAEKLGASNDSTDSLRASILQALGRYPEALEIRQRLWLTRADILSIGALAALLGEMGQVEEAERLFTEAQHSYRDVSPFPFAWLWFQQGKMWLEAGRPERARERFAAAHERLPGYVAALTHLGETEADAGEYEDAIRHLRAAAEASEDPDALGQLARVLGDSGRAEQSATISRTAAERWESLLSRHPEAWADHGAEFWLGAGRDPARALIWARRNLELRETPRAYLLALQAAISAGDRQAACSIRNRAKSVERPSEILSRRIADAGQICL